jgi:hypothetical protein
MGWWLRTLSWSTNDHHRISVGYAHLYSYGIVKCRLISDLSQCGGLNILSPLKTRIFHMIAFPQSETSQYQAWFRNAHSRLEYLLYHFKRNSYFKFPNVMSRPSTIFVSIVFKSREVPTDRCNSRCQQGKNLMLIPSAVGSTLSWYNCPN